MSLLLLLRPDYATYIPASFHGSVDEVAVYNSALSAATIKRHYEIAKATPGAYSDEILSSSPKGYWRLGESVGTTATDSSGLSHNGTYTGSNVTYGVTGVLDTEGTFNTFALYFREEALDLQTQIDLDTLTQANLDIANAQPDFGEAQFANRTQEEMDMEDQESLSGESMFDLERIPDNLSLYYLEVKLKWSESGGTLTIKDSNGAGYTFTVPAFTGTEYYLITDLKEHSIRVRIYEADEAGNLMQNGEVTSEFFDTTLISDPSLLIRRKGRFGWYARFADGDASIEDISPRGLNFGEVVTKPLDSITPVEGAALDVGASPDRILFNALPGAAPWGGTTTLDPTKTTSGKAVRIEATGSPMQGISTDSFLIDDFEQLDISFDILFPSTGLTDSGFGLEAFLYGDFAKLIPVNIGGFAPDRWQKLNVYLANDYIVPGTYSLVVIQTTPVTNTWWVDNLVVKTRAIEWSGRGHKPDPWGMEPQGWVPFRDMTNRQDGGIVFEKRGNELQIRGQSRRHDSFIDNLKATPKYAELGRFLWADEHAIPTSVPNGVISAPTISGQSVLFNGGTSTCTGGRIVAYHWSFGDGRQDFGRTVRHKYKVAGTYAVTLTVIDNNNLRDSASTSVTVS